MLTIPKLIPTAIVRGWPAKPSAKLIKLDLLGVNLPEDLKMAILVEPIADNGIRQYLSQIIAANVG